MARLVPLALLALPFLEIAAFIKVGELIGVAPTIELTLLASFAGVVLMRAQGLATLARAREAALADRPPLEELLDGLAILLAGALLIVPGFITDVLGLLLFVPPVRRALRRRIWRSFEVRERRSHGMVINAEYTVVERDARGPSAVDRLDSPDKTRDKR
ncbi:MAG TPA: FxsA family protein [Alphaproteobacteria bacterium]|nr:FxsA family protein [Alphaproteobacteria bacterium]